MAGIAAAQQVEKLLTLLRVVKAPVLVACARPTKGQEAKMRRKPPVRVRTNAHRTWSARSMPFTESTRNEYAPSLVAVHHALDPVSSDFFYFFKLSQRPCLFSHRILNTRSTRSEHYQHVLYTLSCSVRSPKRAHLRDQHRSSWCRCSSPLKNRTIVRWEVIRGTKECLW